MRASVSASPDRPSGGRGRERQAAAIHSTPRRADDPVWRRRDGRQRPGGADAQSDPSIPGHPRSGPDHRRLGRRSLGHQHLRGGRGVVRFATLWTALLTFPMMIAVQFTCAKIGMVTGMGLARGLGQAQEEILGAGLVAFTTRAADG